MSWIDRDDLVGIYFHALEREGVSGPLLGTAPEPVRNAEFTKALGRALGRPTIFPMPGWMMRALFGRVAEVLLSSQRCRPRRTLASGFTFEHPDLGEALGRALSA
jgi:hypothetical protein